MSKHMVRIEVSNDLLRSMLKMPFEAEITRVYNVGKYRAFEIVVEHPDLPAVEEGGHIPLIEPVVNYETEKYTFDWNLPEARDE